MSGYPAWVYRKTEDGTIDGVIVPTKEAHDALPPGWYGTPDEALASTPSLTPPDPTVAPDGPPNDMSEGVPEAETETGEDPPKRTAKGQFRKRGE
jgi:hypothetical protein